MSQRRRFPALDQSRLDHSWSANGAQTDDNLRNSDVPVIVRVALTAHSGVNAVLSDMFGEKRHGLNGEQNTYLLNVDTSTGYGMTSDGFEATITPEWVGNTVLPRKHNFVTLEMMPEQWRNEADPRVRMELEKRFRW